MFEAVKIIAVLPTFNRCEMLEKTLIDLFNLKIPHGVSFEIIVVVDGSTDGTLEMLSKQFRMVHVILCENYWYTKSMNAGFRKAIELNPEYVLTLNDDIHLPENFLIEIIKAVRVFDEPVLMGSLGISIEEPQRATSVGVEKMHPVSLKYIAYPNIKIETAAGIQPSIVLPGRGMLIPTEVLMKLNFFDERFVQYQSDFDFCLRAKKKGYKSFICYNARAYNYALQTSRSSSFIKKSFSEILKQFFDEHSRIYILAKARFIYRHGIKPIWPLSFLIFIVATLKSNLFSQKYYAT